MSKQRRSTEKREKPSNVEMAETEFTDEQRQKNEVASTAYTGSSKKKVDLQHDRLETGGF